MDDTPQKHVYDAIQETAGQQDEEMEDAVLVSYVTVAEWVLPDGSRQLTELDGQANGDRLARWQAQGLMFNLLHDPAWRS
jgi:hypothetical protein